MSDPTVDPLWPLEARVLGVLIEKQAVTPDTYPLTLNALTAGCNQKTSRHPIMDASESEVQTALDQLKRRTLVIESHGASGRVLRYAHKFPKVFNLGTTATTLLAVLMLRGPQTPGELRLNCERMQHAAGTINQGNFSLSSLLVSLVGAVTLLAVVEGLVTPGAGLNS